MSDDANLPPELIEEALRVPESDRAPDELERLLATRPAIANIFSAAGLPTLSEALAHPTLGSLLWILPDRLHWSKGRPEETGAEGIERFLLAHAFALAGHPIHSMPPIRDLAALVHDRGKNHRGARITALWRRLRGIYGRYFGPLMLAPTLHGTDMLIANFEPLKAQILKAKRKYVPSDLDESDLDDFFRRVTDRAVLAAMRFDPGRGVELSTFAFKYIDGAARDWRAEYYGINPRTGDRFQSRSRTTSLDISVGFDGGRELTLGDVTVDQSTEYHGEERPSFAEVVQSPDLTTKERGHLIGLATHKGSAADYARSRGIAPGAIRQLIHRVKNKFR